MAYEYSGHEQSHEDVDAELKPAGREMTPLIQLAKASSSEIEFIFRPFGSNTKHPPTRNSLCAAERPSVVGSVRLEMPHICEQLFTRATFDCCGPADEVGARAKECNDRAVPHGAALEAAIDPPAMRTT